LKPSAPSRVTHLAYRVVLATSWQRAAIAFLAGAVSTLALAPLNAWPVLFISFPILVWLVDGSVGGRFGGLVAAAVAGWWFGFGYFLIGLYWIGFAFLVDAHQFAWLLPFAVAGLPAYLALYTAAALALARLFWTRGPTRLATLAVAVTICEWLRGHLFTGFPWNAFGYALTGPLPMAQSAALFGLWGLTFLAVLIFASPAVLADDHADTPRPWLMPIAGVVVLVLLAGYGMVRLARHPTTFVEGTRLRIMQPNLTQDEKFNYSARREVMSRYITLSEHAGGPGGADLSGITHLIWPESAFPFFLTREPEALAQIAHLLPEGAVLITGAARAAQLAPSGAGIKAYNSVYVIDHDGSLSGVYDKLHLVPFGEYLPFQSWLERLGLMQLTKVSGGFLPGETRRSMTVPRAPAFLPLICYEIIFPGEAVPPGERPGWLLNVTNDGWFGHSAGPYQHFHQARVRAIEEGLPLVRAANTGISAVVDPVGRIITVLPLGAEGSLDSPLPARIEPTFYARNGNRIAWVMMVAAGILIVRRRLRAR